MRRSQPVFLGTEVPSGTPIGLATETNTAFPVTAVVGTPIGQAVETDTAFAITSAKIKAIGQAVETDTAFAVISGIGISDDYSRSSVNTTGSSVSGTGDSAIITVQPRKQESEVVSSGTRWLEPSARISDINGLRPTFRFSDYGSGEAKYHGFPWPATRFPMFSYDRETWFYFDTKTVNTTYVEFRHNTAFTSDIVYVSRSRQFDVEQTGQWLKDLETAHSTIFGPSDAATAFTPTLTGWAGQDFIADEFASQTNELSATIPATPFYAAEINDTGLSPPSGVKDLAVVVSGVHAGEDHGSRAMQEFIEYALGSSTEAQDLRRYYRILIYPMVNAPGREGGGWRGSFTQGVGGVDDANRHFDESGTTLEIIDIPKAVMVSDVGSDVPHWMVDMHAMFSSNWGLHEDVGNTLQATLRTRLATNSGFTVGDTGNTVVGYVSRYFQDTLNTQLAVTIEHGDPVSVSDAQLETWGQALVESLDSMRADALFGLDVAIETDTALPITSLKTKSIGLATENNTAFAISVATGTVLGLATETNTAQSITGAKEKAVGLAQEVDSAFDINIDKTVQVGLSVEIDTGFGIDIERSVTIGQAIETDTAFPLEGPKFIAVGQALEADIAFPLSGLDVNSGSSAPSSFGCSRSCSFSCTPGGELGRAAA